MLYVLHYRRTAKWLLKKFDRLAQLRFQIKFAVIPWGAGWPVRRVLASHTLYRVLFRPDVIRGLSFWLVLVLLRGFFSGFSNFPPSIKTNIPNSNSTRVRFSKGPETFRARTAIFT